MGVEIEGTYTDLGDEHRAELVKAVHDAGRRGLVPMPRNPDLCASIISRYRAYLDQVLAEFTQRVAEKTASEKMQAKVVAALMRRLVYLSTEGGSGA